MLRKLTTKNFRKLEDNVFEFGPGLQVVRGANEAGKSTMLEAIAYALFGAKACRESLEQVVTWGKDAKSLAVELAVVFEDVEYVVTRSPRGAEVNYAGGRVVGQGEVTAFISKMLGADAKVAGKLMLASQGGIRGTLEEGGTATIKLIESLADFEVVDYVIELIQSNLLTGPTSVPEDRLKSAQAALEVAKQAATPPNTIELEQKSLRCSEGIAARQHSIDTNLKPWFEKAQGNVNAARGALKQREDIQREIERLSAARNQRLRDLEAAEKVASSGPTDGAVEMARKDLAGAESSERELAIYRQFEALTWPEVFWEGDKASFDDAVNTAERHARECRQSIAGWTGEMRALVSSYNGKGDTCKACGQKLPDAAAIVAHNREIDAKVKDLDAHIATARRQAEAAEADLADLQGVTKAAQPIEAFLARHGERVGSGGAGESYPPRFHWKGAEPQVRGVTALRAKLHGLEAAQKAAIAARARADMLEKQIDEDTRTMKMREEQIAQCSYADNLAELEADFAEAQRGWNTASGEISELKYLKDQVQDEIRALRAAYEVAKRGAETAARALEQAKRELEDLDFNNTLLKRVRQARPVIADKLWSIVLAAVSNYFSQMRGTKSIVTRQGNEFLVDGKPIAGLSGSTLDVLGLGIRLALTRTFLPNSPLLVLDEPAAAMDENRTAATMGFLVSAGFAQTLVVTHEDQTESVAQNLITI
jgi:DNA repair exonuclease SbcCD ATPase subunit